jgi:hypothetical protein
MVVQVSEILGTLVTIKTNDRGLGDEELNI